MKKDKTESRKEILNRRERREIKKYTKRNKTEKKCESERECNKNKCESKG
jgi:hypothetical protein